MNINKVFKNSIINLCYQIIPILTALLMVPFTINKFGKELFAIYSIAVTFIVLFNYLNFGIAQATNRELASLDKSSYDEINNVFGSGLIAIIFVGIVISLLGLNVGELLVNSITSHSSEYKEQASTLINGVISFSVLFLSVIYFRAVLESRLLFKVTAANRAVLNTIIFSAPAICFLLGYDIEKSLEVIIVSHIISVIFLWFNVSRLFYKIRVKVNISVVRSLLVSGGWMTLVSVSSIGLYYVDRFIIGSLVGLTALAYYVASYDLISRSSIVYGSITSVFFPAFSYWNKNKKYEEFSNALGVLYNLMFTGMGIIVGCVILVAPDFLNIWIGPEFKLHATLILQILAIGILFVSIGIIPTRALLATNNERFVAIYYTIQSILYLIVSYIAILLSGILGGAIVFTVRAVVEAVFLTCFMKYKLTTLDTIITRAQIPTFLLVLSWLLCAFYLSSVGFALRMFFGGAFVILVFLINYRVIFQLDKLSSILKNRQLSTSGNDEDTDCKRGYNS